MLYTQAASRALYDYKLSCCANEIVNKWVYICFLNCSSDDSRWSESGRLFHARGAATVKARSPIVDRRMHGTTSREWQQGWHLKNESIIGKTYVRRRHCDAGRANQSKRWRSRCVGLGRCTGAFQVEMNRQSNKHRTINCYYNPTEPGTYMIYVNWSGDPVPHSPFRVYIADSLTDLQRYESGATGTATTTHRQAGPNAVNGADFYEDDDRP